MTRGWYWPKRLLAISWFKPCVSITLGPMALYTIPTNGTLDPHLAQEWLLTNGLGGFASSSVVGCNTRRYHSLLVAARTPPVDRINTVNRMGEVLRLDGKADRTLEFSSNQFANHFHPHGEQYLRQFELDDTARWTYDVEGVRIEKELLVAWGQNLVGLRYRVDPAGREFELDLLPFVSLRDFHSERRAGVQFDVKHSTDWLDVTQGSLRLCMRCDGGDFVRQGDWWYGHFYAIESARGLSCQEDLYTPGRFTLSGNAPKEITIWISLDPIEAPDWNKLFKHRQERIKQACGKLATATPAQRKLARAANDFVVYRKDPDGQDGLTVIAGYPWFADWGRDTMISLPGLFLTPGRYDDAKRVLSVFAKYVSQGMIPNRFDDYNNTPHYNTVDASLWFIHACHEYLKHTQDDQTYKSVLQPACAAIVQGYKNGTRFQIKMDEADGLISQGDWNTQLTWMDAKCDGIAFTPRQGKAVEINALWYHALRLMGEHALADHVKAGFVKTFWTGPFRGLADVVDGTRKDAAIRPNQIFAVSLPNSPLTQEQQLAVVEIVRRELLTPVGLRTLAPGDPNFHRHFSGPPRQRDEAYHNGTIWPWPIGAFFEAYLKVHDRSEAAVAQVKAWLAPLIDHLNHQACIGSISEVFEAEPPHAPGGCPAQAWSVAEVLRLAVEVGL